MEEWFGGDYDEEGQINSDYDGIYQCK